MPTIAFSQKWKKQDTLTISDNIYLYKLTDKVWVHVSPISRFTANGMLLIEKKKAFLFDTPINDSLTELLVGYIQKEMQLTISGFVTSDWHIDSQGGLGYVNSLGIPSYGCKITRDTAKSKGLPITSLGFDNSHTIKFGKSTIELYYFGAAHTHDNILAWIPEEKVLHGSCMIKETSQNNLGFTGDGNTHTYPETVEKVLQHFPDAMYVIPGHGKPGGIELVEHTLKVAQRIAAQKQKTIKP